MRRSIFALVFVLGCAAQLCAQTLGVSAAYWTKGSGAPSSTCSATVNNGVFYTSAALNLYQCSNVGGSFAWNPVGGTGAGVQYNPSVTRYYFLGDSHIVRSSPLTATAVSCNGTNCTVTIPNTFVVGQTPLPVSGPPGTFSPSCMAFSAAPVISTGLSSSQYEVSEAATPSCSGTVTGTGGEVDDDRFFIPALFASEPFVSGHGTVYNLGPGAGSNGGHIVSLAANYSTVLHPYTPAVTGVTPTYIVLQIGWGDVNDACVSAATLESDLQSIWTSLHADGAKILMTTDITPGNQPGSVSGCGFPSATEQMLVLNNWLVAQGKGGDPSVTANWDYLVDLSSVLGAQGSPSGNAASNYNGDASNGGNKIAADFLNNAVAAQGSMSVGTVQGPKVMTGEQMLMQSSKYTYGNLSNCVLSVGDWPNAAQSASLSLEDYDLCNSYETQDGDSTHHVPFVMLDGGQTIYSLEYRNDVTPALVQTYTSTAMIGFQSGSDPHFGPDVTLSRLAGSIIAFGGYHGAPGDASGAWKASYGYFAGVASDPGSPANGECWYNSTAHQLKCYINGVTTAVGAGITALTGDVTASGPGSAAATLATVNSGPGSCGDATHVCQVTTNGKGLVTAQSAVAVTTGISGMTAGQVPIAAGAATITSSMPLAGSGAGIATGPTSSTTNDVAGFTGTGGQLQDLGFAYTAYPAADIAAGALANGMAATTQTAGDNSTKLATTAYAQAQIAAWGATLTAANTVSGLPSGCVQLPCTLTLATDTYTGKTANIGTTSLLASATAGMYALRCTVVITTAATSSSTTPQCKAQWTDATSGNSVQGTGLVTSAANTTGIAVTNDTTMDVQAASTISFLTASYASSGATAMVYKVRLELVRIK